MSFWQFNAMVDGWAEAHVPDDPGALSASEQDEIWSWLQEKDGRVVN